MRRVVLVGVLLVAISSFLALQAMCRPYFICAKRTCEVGGRMTSALEACVAQESKCRSGRSPCAEVETNDMGCEARQPCAEGPRPCMPDFDLAADKTCCETKEMPEPGSSCPNRVLSCVYCIPARFVWEPPSLHATRDSDNSNLPAVVATIALNDGDQARRLTHTHSPPGTHLALAGADRRISICSFLL